MDNRLTRVDDVRCHVENQHGIDATLFANKDVPLESVAVDELLTLFQLKDTIQLVNKDYTINKVAITPDFHKAQGIPVGTVLSTEGFFVPQAIGSDINCGMRLHTTNLSKGLVEQNKDSLEKSCRHMYFEGGRNIPMSRVQREALFKDGLLGLASATNKNFKDGLWALFNSLDIDKELNKIEHSGSYTSDTTKGLEDFLGPSDRLSRDSQIGCIGGGNHFVEIQYVHKIFNNSIAYEWGLKKDAVVVMIHSGSLTIGKYVSNKLIELLKKNYPSNTKYPNNGIIPSNFDEESLKDALNRLHNACNFAFANRMFLSLMVWDCLNKISESEFKLLYDAPHNMMWGSGNTFIHRKGACPARGALNEDLSDTPFYSTGEPVIVPGSMGASSYLLVGQGNSDALDSASHGAGRKISRGDAMKGHEKEFEEFLREFRVVTPVDFNRNDIKSRKDIVSKKLEELKQEAPFAYKGITSIIETLQQAGIASLVAEFRPIMSIKG